MSGYAMAAFIVKGEITSETVADACLSHFWNSVGLPRLIIVDDDGLFKDVFVRTFDLLKIPVMAVSKENHKAVLNENFHKYLNKVERINTADTDSLWRWKQGVLFSLYAWNSSPVDGTDIPRSEVAVGRKFPFPIDLSPPVPRSTTIGGQQALDHFEALSPLLYKQRQLLAVLNSERRRRHAELRNRHASGVEFEPGDLVIARKQVKSDASQGLSAKLVFRPKGPYRVIEKINPNSYKVQKLPFLRGLGRKGRYIKESAARLSMIPSTLIFHKMADGADTRFSLMGGDIADNALEKWIGVLRRGAYLKAEGDPNWAFEPLASMWSDELPDDDDDDDSDMDDDDDDDDPDMPAVDAADSDDSDDGGGLEGPTVPQPAPSPAADPTKLAEPSASDRKALRRLRKAISDSHDRLVIVRVQDNPTQPATFQVGQVDWESSDPHMSERFGVYRVKWWRPHLEDSDSR